MKKEPVDFSGLYLLMDILKIIFDRTILKIHDLFLDERIFTKKISSWKNAIQCNKQLVNIQVKPDEFFCYMSTDRVLKYDVGIT